MYKREDFEKLNEQVHHYAGEGKLLDALKCAFECLKIAEHLFPPFHILTGECLNNLGYLLHMVGKYEEADNYYRKALAVIEKSVGPENLHLCPTLDSLSIMYDDNGQYQEMEPLLERSLAIKRKTYGLKHPEVARALNKLGNLYLKLLRFSEAEKNYKDAIACWEAIGPGIDIEQEIVSAMLNLGETLRSRGNYAEAEGYMSHGLEILLQVLPPDHSRMVPFFSNLGNLYYGKGEYQKSLSYYNRALEVCIQSYNEKHPLTLQCMNSVAMTLKTIGEFEKAEAIYSKFTAIWSQMYSLDAPELIPVYTDMAAVYERLGDIEKAEQNHQTVLRIRHNFLGANHIEVAISLINLGNLKMSIQDFLTAKTFYEKARSILERQAVPVTSPWIYNYMALANMYKRFGKYKEAEKFYQKAFTAGEAVMKSDPEAFALVLGNLGGFYLDNHNYIKAEEHLNHALQIRSDNITADHPENIMLLLYKIALQVNRRNFTDITSCFKEIISIQDRLIEMILSFAKEEQKVTFIDNVNTVYSACLSFINKFMSQDREAISFGLGTVFQRKGMVIDMERRTVETIVSLLPDEAKKIWLVRSDKLSHLSQLILGNAPEVTANTLNRKEQIAKLQEEIAVLENELKISCDLAARILAKPTGDITEVAGAMPANTALLEFVKIRDFDFHNILDPWGLIRYIVFVLKPGGDMKLIDLGRAFDIEQTIIEVIHSIREAQEGPEHILNQLYKLLWAPLENSLQGIDKVVISPDGMLNLAPFAAIIDDQGVSLLERFTITHVTSGREIAPVEKKIPATDVLVLAADANFDYREVIQLRPDLTRAKTGTFWFKPLPGTAQEASEIPLLIPGDPVQKKVFLKEKASKNTVLNVVNPRILHIATHGFSFPNPIDRFFPEANGLSRGLHLLTQMGLALAGANHADIESGNDSGLLTIMEITGMELQGTDLVVLSASNPGIGEFTSGVGIFAFKRAFALAGAKNLVMNLWPINEKYTLWHMKEFYKNLAHMAPAEALRQTQLQMIEELKKSEGYAGQNLWAAFIIQGGQALTPPLFN